MSRKNREKRRKNDQKKLRVERLARTASVERDFRRHWESMEGHLVSFRALDVYLCLLTSELWLPNISAQIRHLFAVSVFLATPPDRFSATPIENYGTFQAFVGGLHSLMPSFPMLEDYVPEPDWGEIKIQVGNDFLRTFYGGLCERIPDFVDAFRIKRPGGNEGGVDLDTAIVLQNFLLSRIGVRPLSEDIQTGDLQVPPESFWSECWPVLLACGSVARGLALSPDLVVAQGGGAQYGRSAFGDGVMAGEVLPYVLVEVGTLRLPVSPRNLVCAVIDYWERRDTRSTVQVERDAAATMAEFLRMRLPSREIFSGPLRMSLRNADRRFVEVAAMLRTDSETWVVAVIDPRRLQGLPSIERRVSTLFAEDGGVVVQDLNSGEVLRFQSRRAADGESVLRILAVIADSSTGMKSVRIFPSPSRKLFLPDFTSVISSVNDVEELSAYFAFAESDGQRTMSMFTGAVDLLAAFVQSHAMLVDGAVEPALISLDPHWGSNWRYQTLKEFWGNAPRTFPDDSAASWKVTNEPGGARRLESRVAPKLVWAADIEDGPTLHFMLDVDLQRLRTEDGRLLETFMHCLADSLEQRAKLIPRDLFKWNRVQTLLYVNEERLPFPDLEDEGKDDRPLFGPWRITGQSHLALELSLVVDLRVVAAGLRDARDARFEAYAASEWLKGFASITAASIDDSVLAKLAETGDRRPRFTLQVRERDVDVPDLPRPELPLPKHYKAARRQLAIVAKQVGIQPGRYELAEAKAVIDRARNAYRVVVHEMIGGLDVSSLVRFGVEQFDELIADYDRTNAQVRISLSHDVEFDRGERLAQAYDEFLKNSKAYRYLIECALSSELHAGDVPDVDQMVQVVAYIDWLLVLYEASDTLHNEVDVGGIEIDSSYVPTVFYSDFDSSDIKRDYVEERLGMDRQGDETAGLDEGELGAVDQAFLADTGFTMTSLLQVLAALSRWPSVSSAEAALAWSYSAEVSDLIRTVVASFVGADEEQVKAAISFLTLDRRRIRVLSGRSGVEADVPVWEHIKRDHRYAIRPLVSLGDNKLTWGAATVARAFTIWSRTLSDGYPPADFGWPRVSEVSTLVKRRIENELEVLSFEVCRRHLSFVEMGIDFRSRFPSEGFDDVGDFDVLGYDPARNLWLMVECKYNKPPFSVKDARRLREHIFGKTGHGGQLSKIERRREFLQSNQERLRLLLGWPSPEAAKPGLLDLYVCPRIFYWMRRPPRPVETVFVRLGVLDAHLVGVLGTG